MVTKRDDDRPTDNRQGEYRAICLGEGWKAEFCNSWKIETQLNKGEEFLQMECQIDVKAANLSKAEESGLVGSSSSSSSRRRRRLWSQIKLRVRLSLCLQRKHQLAWTTNSPLRTSGKCLSCARLEYIFDRLPKLSHFSYGRRVWGKYVVSCLAMNVT